MTVHAWSVRVSQPRSLHTCSGRRFLASKAIVPELRDASVLVLCSLKGLSELVVGFVKNITDAEKSINIVKLEKYKMDSRHTS